MVPTWLEAVTPVLSKLVFMSRDSLQGEPCREPYPHHPLRVISQTHTPSHRYEFSVLCATKHAHGQI